MNINGNRFAILAASMAAATVIAGCPSEADQQVGEQRDGVCIENPGAGSQNAELYSFQEGVCFELARFAPSPDVEGLPAIDNINSSYEGSGIDFDDYLYQHCRMYSSQMRPAIAKEVEACLLDANDKREINDSGDPIGRFDWSTMYGCGAHALGAICTTEETLDKRSTSRCGRIAGALESRGQGDNAMESCLQTMTGLRGSARQQIETCVINERYDIYTCVEGLVDDSAWAFDSEPKDACQQVYEFDEPQASCDAVVARLTPDEEWARDFVTQKCNSYLEEFSGVAADVTIACLMDPSEEVSRRMYACGTDGLRAVCRTEDVHGACQAMVDTIDNGALEAGQDETPNAGGRITKQCRALLPGLRPAAQTKVAECVASETAGFAQYGMATYTFYSCIEGL